MSKFLTLCRDDFILVKQTTSQITSPVYTEYYVESLIKSFEYAAYLLIKSVNAGAELYAGDPRGTVLVIRVNDPYEAFIMSLHLDVY